MRQRAVQEALTERLVDEVASARPMIVFPHAVIREALTASSDGAGRARLHLAIAEALEEDPDAEPAELARHYGLAVAIAGPARAIASYQAAGLAAAEEHDHEQAAAQVHSALTLIPESDLSARAPLLLELGEQRLLAADLPLAREAFRAAGDAARSIGDTNSLALAALGYAGGDIAFGYETGSDDPSTEVLLREGLEALGDDDPRLALRMIFRLAISLGVTDDDEVFPALARRARDLDGRLGDTESQVLARYVELVRPHVSRSRPAEGARRVAEAVHRAERGRGGMRPSGPAVPRGPIVRVCTLDARADGRVRSGDRACRRDR